MLEMQGYYVYSKWYLVYRRVSGWVIKTKAKWIDCEQSLSFPSVFLAFLRASVYLSSSERRDAFLRASVSFSNLHSFN